MKVLVLGATGNVGTCVVRRLLDDPGVTELVGASRRRPAQFPAPALWRAVDLAQPLPTDLLDGVDAVVNLAWLMQPTRDPDLTWQANVLGTARLLDAIALSQVRVLLQASSVGAYSAKRDDTPVSETWPTHGVPTSAYSREKAYVERLLDIFEREHHRTRVVRMRPAFTFQAGAATQQRRLFAGPLVPGRFLAEGRLPVLPDPGGVEMQAVHADDVAHAYQLALAAEDAAGAYNLSAGDTVDMPTIASMLGARVVQVPRGLSRAGIHAAWAARLTPTSPGLFDLLNQVPRMSTQRAHVELGWQPAWSGGDAVRDMLAGLRDGTAPATPPLDPRTSGPLRSHEVWTNVRNTP
ncbi:NAD-dependent epimerase/dehydratase family protein [Luteipulveratus sp. YIM 133132]|uniref:NAD-dependent epimerase/dehydratase family protein n=1 Tax=Luteipulveratus flavus TaxID=3031728 RepID=UPI0023AEB344|nr:NAD-dependent epimerase/dehydratase family protein [Luteipulveratus sp. YIM 133132]MDE9365692.1 NAD-dependent epimerase/dehydratase family protein [Luteipulveratus sp. YIM 133132]